MLQILSFLVLWSVAAPLSAQVPAPSASPPPAAGAEYERLVDDAVAEFRRRNFAEARSLFARANALNPNARTLRGLGMTELELGNFIDSSELLRSALDSKVRPLEGTLRSETECINLRESKSRPNAGIVTWAHRSFNQRGELVCECTRSALLLKTPQ